MDEGRVGKENEGKMMMDRWRGKERKNKGKGKEDKRRKKWKMNGLKERE